MTTSRNRPTTMVAGHVHDELGFPTHEPDPADTTGAAADFRTLADASVSAESTGARDRPCLR